MREEIPLFEYRCTLRGICTIRIRACRIHFSPCILICAHRLLRNFTFSFVSPFLDFHSRVFRSFYATEELSLLYGAFKCSVKIISLTLDSLPYAFQLLVPCCVVETFAVLFHYYFAGLKLKVLRCSGEKISS